MVQSGYLSWIGKVAGPPKASFDDWRAAVHRFAHGGLHNSRAGTKGIKRGEFVHHAEALAGEFVPAAMLFG
jgi:hypothetical protein